MALSSSEYISLCLHIWSMACPSLAKQKVIMPISFLKIFCKKINSTTKTYTKNSRPFNDRLRKYSAQKSKNIRPKALVNNNGKYKALAFIACFILHGKSHLVFARHDFHGYGFSKELLT